MDELLNEENIKNVNLSLSVVKSILDRCIVSGNVFKTLDEAVITNSHLVRIATFVDKIKNYQEKRKD